ncbi:SDR family oxidoreductase [Rhodococcus sp. (in: high G+C Gram-positive bacteria)]|uniref:SDR family NAD(P)-dependent oxidoreductase n=1 Tax=Rhodococcus sp. TaxID=1831 RepID=UPI002580F19D|nr:SDR family oxidoreductase [Rhodococcus sp. (in: high G+C Gram-positive bacteria)]MBQ7805749.1 SDR family oxidoreductase [Rhodococcus sp. (in: high G+C Gram-positive bacteria)]
MSRRVALVTGATRGIGAATATLLARDGWDLVVTARTAEPLQRFAAALAADTGRSITAVEADLAVESASEVIGTSFRRVHDRLDALVLNAGMGSIGPFADFPLRKLDKLLTVNVRSSYALIQQMLPLLRSTGSHSDHGARVIALSSMTGIAAEPLNSAYGATKAALISLCETLTLEEHANGVVATAVCPGYVATDMTVGLADTVDPATMIPVSDVAEVLISLTRLSRNVTIPYVAMTRPGPNVWRA